MKNKKKQKIDDVNVGVWRVLLGITILLFSIVGLVKIIVDKMFLEGSFYIITVIVFILGFTKISKSEKTPQTLALGFILMVIGVNLVLTTSFLGVGAWICGLILFLLGFK